MMLNYDHYYSCIFILVALKELVLVSEEGGRENRSEGKRKKEGHTYVIMRKEFKTHLHIIDDLTHFAFGAFSSSLGTVLTHCGVATWLKLDCDGRITQETKLWCCCSTADKNTTLMCTTYHELHIITGAKNYTHRTRTLTVHTKTITYLLSEWDLSVME